MGSPDFQTSCSPKTSDSGSVRLCYFQWQGVSSGGEHATDVTDMDCDWILLKLLDFLAGEASADLRCPLGGDEGVAFRPSQVGGRPLVDRVERDHTGDLVGIFGFGILQIRAPDSAQSALFTSGLQKSRHGGGG